MNKIAILLLGIALPISTIAAPDPDINDFLNKLGSSAAKTDSTSTSSSGLGAFGNIVSGLISKSDITVADMAGTWKYSAPAVCFQSDNLLKKAGGAAAAATIEGKIAPYYSKVGLNKLSLEISTDSTFVMQLAKGSLKGTISKDDAGDFLFRFKALGKINVGSMKTYVSMTGTSDMSLTFDVSKLISIVKAAGSISGNSTIKGVSSLLESYDGICAGFKLKKQQ